MNKNNELSLKLRKFHAAKKKKTCDELYRRIGFNLKDATHYNLEELIQVGNNLQTRIDFENPKFEEIDDTQSFLDSDLLHELFMNCSESCCFVYSQNCRDCGMYRIETKSGIPYLLNLAKSDYQETCYLIDEEFKYYIIVNYLKNECVYDIQLRLAR
jgi:hypothetical protein